MANPRVGAYEVKWLIVGALIMLGLLWMALPFVTPIVFALFLYYIARPIKRRLKPHVKNESLQALLCLLLIGLPLLAVLGYTVLLAVNQVGNLLSSGGAPSLPAGPLANASALVPRLQQGPAAGGLGSGDLAGALEDIYGQLGGYAGTLLGVKDVLVAAGLVFVDVVFKLSLMIIIAFLLLVGDDRLA
ncbi:MAG TPA: AI-2E family transporter, partial [Methanocella sp.]|nr:AI-2E family transporter [Methanocella sp.]